MTEPRLQWDDSFLIGIDELDFEHKRPIEDALERWIVDHILVSDRKMSAMLAASK